MSEHKIIMYSTPTCGYCKTAKEFFAENNVKFEEKDVTKDSEAMNELMQKSSSGSVPVIDVDGEVIVGFDEAKLKEKLGL